MKILLKTLLNKEALLAARQSITAIFAWIFGYPLTFLIKRDPNLTIVIGRQGQVFADNSKYFFIAAIQYAKANERVVFLTGDRFVRDAIIQAGGLAVLHPSRQSLWLILQCATLVADMADWIDFGVYQLSRTAKRVQIWHGAPLKQIELDFYRERLRLLPAWAQLLLRLQKYVIGRYPVYDFVVATSQGFIDAAFKGCFKSKQFLASGYPRNDVLLGWPELNPVLNTLLQVNVDEQSLIAVQKAKSAGRRICLYVPTFRKDKADPFAEIIDLARLSEFAGRKNLCVVLKLHPAMQGHYCIAQYPNLLEYQPLNDVYPLMAECDILITDYSSIFFDFLLLDRPIIFFATDLKRYLNQDRGMYFDYDAMTPGVKCYSYDTLEQQLAFILDNGCDDGYAEMRARVRTYTHDFIDNKAGWRLLEILHACQND